MDNIEIISANVNCNYCFKDISATDKFCSHCGFPIQGTDDEQKIFIAEMNIPKVNVEEAEKKIKSATTTLYVLAGLNFVFGLIMYLTSDAVEYLVVAIFVPLLFGLLGVWSKKKPLAAIATGLILYLSFMLIEFFDNPASIFKGIIIKGFIIAYLIKGVKGAYEAEKTKKQYPSIFN